MEIIKQVSDIKNCSQFIIASFKWWKVFDVLTDVRVVFAKAPYCLGGGGGECEPSGWKYVNVGFVTTILAMIVGLLQAMI